MCPPPTPTLSPFPSDSTVASLGCFRERRLDAGESRLTDVKQKNKKSGVLHLSDLLTLGQKGNGHKRPGHQQRRTF